MKLILSTLAILSIVISTGCISVGTTTKAEMLSKPSTQFVIAANYILLARYWDDYADKSPGPNGSFLTMLDEEQRAEITIGNGPYWGMIELKRIDDHSTLVTSYAWDYSHKVVRGWEELLRTYPNHNSSQPLK